jgi:hypothetical protein
MKNEELNPEIMMKMSTANWTTKVLVVATEFGIFTELAEQPKKLSEIAEKLNC